MTKLQLIFYIFICSLMLFVIKEAQAYDLQCRVLNKEDTKYVLGSPKRQYVVKYKSDAGLKTTIFVKDMLSPSEADDYVKYTDDKHTMTYSLSCEPY